MKRRMNRGISFLVALAVLLSGIMLPEKAAKAAVLGMSKNQTGHSLTLNGRTKSSSEMWWNFNIGGNTAFCMTFHKAASPGEDLQAWQHDTFGTTATWTEKTTGNGGLFGKICYWVKKGNTGKINNRKIFAQALVWTIREGGNSEAALKNTISQIQSSFAAGTALHDTGCNELYQEIFNTGASYSVKAWFFKSGSSNRQSFMSFKVTPNTSYDWESASKTRPYHQRILIQKVDENGNPVEDVNFRIKITNDRDTVSTYALWDRNNNGSNEALSENAEDDDFYWDGTTDANGKIGWRVTRLLTSDEWGWKTAGAATKEVNDKIRAEMDKEDIFYQDGLSKEGAEKGMDQDLDAAFDVISNTYLIKELNTGSNSHLTMNGSVALTYFEDGVPVTETYTTAQLNQGIRITLDYSCSWLQDASGNWPDYGKQDYEQAAHVTATDNFKKYSVSVTKRPVNTVYGDNTVYGNADLSGAVYGVYYDADCTSLFNSFITDKDGHMEIGQLNAGTTYYLKEISPPEGFLISDEVQPIWNDGQELSVEYTPTAENMDTFEKPIKAPIEIHKDYGEESDDDTYYALKPEQGATFQIYLKSRGSYEACAEEERQTVTTDRDGNAKTKDLPYGTYIIHQTDSGTVDTYRIADQEVTITQNAVPVKASYVNRMYKAYLKIIKKDGDTDKPVLKEGFTYKIYRVDAEGKEELVTQKFSDKDGKHEVSEFTTDASGQLLTMRPLKSGTYRIYETGTGEGFRLGNETYQYLEITIHSRNAGDYSSYTDEDGTVWQVASVTDINDEQKGKLSIQKTGELLKGWNGKKFLYEEDTLKGVTFKLFAEGDIVSQDGQGKVRFKDKELVAIITTGIGAKFTKTYGDLTKAELEDGKVILTLPVGKYRLEEVNTVYGHLLPEDRSCYLEFKPDRSGREYVPNSTDCTDSEGNIRVDSNGRVRAVNDRSKTALNIYKADAASAAVAATPQAVSGAAFGIYTKDAVYNADGEKIVEAGTLLGTVITDRDGKAVTDLDLPMMDVGFKEGEALNSGDYIIRELSISDSYYLNDTSYTIHLEYQNQETPDIRVCVRVTDQQTQTVISKRDLAGMAELPGCELAILDGQENEIIRWISGDMDSIKINENLEKMGYVNFSAEMSLDGLIIHGLFHDTVYTLTELKPVDGYTTAQNMEFMLQKENVKNATAAAIQEGWPVATGSAFTCIKKGEDLVKTDGVIMYDDTTKIRVSKTDISGEKELPGCKMQVRQKDGAVIDTWTSGSEPHYIEGKLVVGQTYILTELKPADGYTTAQDMEFTVKDSGLVQTVTMKDDTTKIRLSKTDISGEKELPGCKMQVRQKDGAVIDTWTSGSEPHYIEGKLVVGQTYILTELKPADGYTTAQDIEFTVKDSGLVQTVTMKDDTTKIRFRKTDISGKKILAGAQIVVSDMDGNEVARFTTNADKTVELKGKLAAGKTYVFSEEEAPDGYQIAKAVKYTVKDSGNWQTVTMKDKKKPQGRIIIHTPDWFPGGGGGSYSPKTGYDFLFGILAVLMLLSGIGIWKKRKNPVMACCIGLLLASLCIPEGVQAAEITRNLTYVSMDAGKKAEEQFDKQISEKGKKYQLKDISYEIVSEEPVKEKKTVEKRKKSGVVLEKGYTPEETITEDGIVLSLKKTSRKKVTVEKGYRQTVTRWQDFGSRKKAQAAPQEKEAKETDKKTGKTVKVLCRRTGIKKTASRWKTRPVSIRFLSYDADTFQWNGLTVNKNEKHPLQGYEQELLESVVGDGEKWELTEIVWSGKPYRNRQGVLCRDARATIRKRTSDYRVFYRGIYEVPKKQGTVYTSVYEGEKEVLTENTRYTIRATAHYEKQKAKIPILGITLGIIFLLIFLVGLLFIAKRKQKHRNDEPERKTV